MADDVDIPPEALAWIPSEAHAYFESGGRELPELRAGFDGAEVHAHYEMQQKRMEHTDTDSMIDMLSAALFKTTGDEEFKPSEEALARKAKKEQELAEGYGNRERVKYEPQAKYAVPKLGEHGSSSHAEDDCQA